MPRFSNRASGRYEKSSLLNTIETRDKLPSPPPPISPTHNSFKMGKDKSEKRDKKEKKEKRSETDGVKKPKKDKKSKLNGDNVAAAFEEVTKEVSAPVVESLVVDATGDVVVKPVGALVPFAAPLADEKVAKKVLKSVKKGSTY